ncbi:MAG: sigma-70 family RNA polymerase sigma factor [Actinomycetota bacterium]|nr:sigma-70 family RNA polymerase sigma factor [Actinomycetota bacterium]
MDRLTALLLDARDGSAPALERLVAETQPTIWRFCAHLVGPDCADDATQETFVAAWSALPSWRAECSARTWLFLLARRSSERVGRRHRRWKDLARSAPSPSPSRDPAAASEIEALLSELDPERRAAIVLTQVLGFTYAEAADICQCAVGTIRSRVARAREQLLALEDEGRASALP